MPENFDFPPTSSSSSSSSSNNRPALNTLDGLRRQLSNTRQRSEPTSDSISPRSQQIGRIRQRIEQLHRANREIEEAAAGMPATPPPPSNGNWRLRRRRSRILAQHASLRPSSTSIADSRQLDSVHVYRQDNLNPNSALLGNMNEPLPDTRSLPMDRSGDMDTNRRSKRRKIEKEPPDERFGGFHYGHYGQVEPGVLKMEIVSCDGGNYSPEERGRFGAENLLKNDMTVYCTSGNQCNIVLKHRGETAFSMSKLVIKAPSKGYTAPVQEGMVFVSMTSDDLLPRTAGYQIQYSPRSAPANESVRQRYRDFAISGRGPRRAERVDSWTTTYNDLLGDTSEEDDGEDVETNFTAGENCDYPTLNPYVRQQPGMSVPSLPPFTVTTDCSDDEDDIVAADDDATRDEVQFRQQWAAEEEEQEDLVARGVARPSMRRRISRSRPSRVNVTPPGDTENPGTEPGASGTSARDQGILLPHARFFIKKEKNKINIHFEPPVSGRYILLKLWSPAKNENIDIQNVAVYGFAGQRFFPAISMK